MAMHQCAHYSHNPHRIHEKAIKCIVHYLIRNKDTQPGKSGYCGKIIDPTDDLTLDCYCDANFVGLWGHEDDQDHSSMKSRTGFALTLGGTPILWVSKIQTEVACLIIETEYIALAHNMQELLPTWWLVEEVAATLGLEQIKVNTISNVWEDNNGALALANSLMP
eukprot:12326125-Ditylum_brightwellii.AAC.1